MLAARSKRAVLGGRFRPSVYFLLCILILKVGSAMLEETSSLGYSEFPPSFEDLFLSCRQIYFCRCGRGLGNSRFIGGLERRNLGFSKRYLVSISCPCSVKWEKSQWSFNVHCKHGRAFLLPGMIPGPGRKSMNLKYTMQYSANKGP